MKDPSLSIITNKLQKGTHPNKPLPNTYFLKTDGVPILLCKRRFPKFRSCSGAKETHQLILTACAMI